jgi:CDP-diacylglycerol pyrophosphatase
MVIVKPHAVVLVMLANAAMLAAVPAEAQNRDALRQIVQEGCAPHWLQAHDPAPCERVYLPDARHDGYAVLADRKGGAHFLLIPTRTISGIESPDVLKTQALNYFAAAWQARDRISVVVGHEVARGYVGMAINPEHGRGQDQLHIHVECLGQSVYDALHAKADLPTDRWSPLELAQGRYYGLRLMGEDLGRTNPCALLANLMPGARSDMGAYTLLLAGMQFNEGPGFLLLAGKSVPGGETLLDSTCAVARR